jgi:hypothetical protein
MQLIIEKKLNKVRIRMLKGKSSDGKLSIVLTSIIPRKTRIVKNIVNIPIAP